MGGALWSTKKAAPDGIGILSEVRGRGGTGTGPDGILAEKPGIGNFAEIRCIAEVVCLRRETRRSDFAGAAGLLAGGDCSPGLRPAREPPTRLCAASSVLFGMVNVCEAWCCAPLAACVVS
jgi:hypothetical protein